MSAGPPQTPEAARKYAAQFRFADLPAVADMLEDKAGKTDTRPNVARYLKWLAGAVREVYRAEAS